MKLSKEFLTSCWCSILGAFVIAYLSVGEPSLSFLSVFLGSALGIATVYYSFVWIVVRVSRKDPFVKEIEQFKEEIKQLPLEEVKAKAYRILEDESKFVCVKVSRAVPEKVASLGTCIHDVFSRYELIKLVHGNETLGWDQITQSDINPAYIRIGRDIDDMCELVVKEGMEVVYDLTGFEEDEKDFQKASYPTIYHWILYMGKSLCRHE
jgi:hypothetical protein